MHIQPILRLTIALLAILNPIGNAAIFVSMIKGDTHAKHKTAISCAIAVAIILLVTIWVGIGLLKTFGISIGAFQTAGGLIVILIGLSMLKGQNPTHADHLNPQAQTNSGSIAVVPLAIPIIAGPGAMTTIILHMTYLNSINYKIIISIICFILAAIIGVVLYFSPYIAKTLGNSGMRIMTSIMGLVITAIAFQMLASGLLKLLPGLA